MAAAAPIPTQAHIEQAPHGTGTHRIWRCPALDSERAHFAPPKWVARQADGSADHLALERALVKPAGIVVPPKCDRDTFHWVVEPPNGVAEGVVYPDGSGQDGRDARVARLGWAFVAVDAAGAITAVARGLPPPWIDDVAGTESRVVLQAAARAAAPLQYRIDCQPCVQAVLNGRKWATAAHRTHARVHGLLHEAVATTQEANFVWMFAHTRPDEVGKVLKGNGVPITNIDWMGNDQADAHAKLAVEAHRVPLVVRKRLADWDREVMQLARWVGLATHLANHLPEYPYRDSVASRAMAQAAKLRRRGAVANGARRRRKKVVEQRPPALGGHDLQWAGGRWTCCACRRSTRHLGRMAPLQCSGSAVVRWADKAATLAEAGVTVGGGHCRQLSGDVMWCSACGAYASGVAKGLAKPCLGRVRGWNGGGRHQQLLALRNGRHPKTGQWIGAAVPEAAWIHGELACPTQRATMVMAPHNRGADGDGDTSFPRCSGCHR